MRALGSAGHPGPGAQIRRGAAAQGRWGQKQQNGAAGFRSCRTGPPGAKAAERGRRGQKQQYKDSCLPPTPPSLRGWRSQPSNMPPYPTPLHPSLP